MKAKSDGEILNEIKVLAAKERKYAGLVLEHLAEVGRRKLYADLKYKSLLAYAIKELGYSESSASRRIQALKLTEKHPELKEKLEQGETSMGMLGDITTLGRMNKLDEGQVKSLIEMSLGKTQEQFREEMKEQNALVLPPRFLKIVVDEKLEKKFERVHGMLVSKGCVKREEVLDYLLEMALEKLQWGSGCREASPERELKSVTPRMRREVFKRDGGKCVNCGSVFQLEVDHVWARSRGGVNRLSNLQCLCRGCNQRKGAVNFLDNQNLDGL